MNGGTAVWILTLALPIAACSKSPSAPDPTVTSVTVTGAAPAQGSSSQFNAVAALSDGSTSTVTSQATWQTSNPLILTVTSAGVVTGVSGGTADVSAIYRQVRGSMTVNVGSNFCVLMIQPQQIAVPNAGGSFGVQVTSNQPGCPWTTAQSNNAFITITNGGSGSGTGGVMFTVAANPGAARTGTLTVAGATVTVTQS
jgi:Putative binding domain, N-terminal